MTMYPERRAPEPGASVVDDGLFLNATAEMEIRVAMGDVDAARIHFVAVLDYADRCEANLLAAAGMPTRRILERGYGLPVVNVTCDYHRPFGLDDVILVRSSFAAVGTTSLTTQHLLSTASGDAALARVRIVHACVHMDTNQTVPAAKLLMDVRAVV